jgi:hypothetical protein
MECEPASSDDVEKAVWPALRVLVASTVAPSLNVTVPLGTPVPGEAAFTVAVKVIESPSAAGFSEETSVVRLEALLTVCVRTVDVLVVKLMSPLYTAVTGWEVTDNVEVV